MMLRLPTHPVPALEVRELPAPPTSYRTLIGPGVIAAGVGVASGEFVLWPYIASQAGLVLLWGAAVAIATQWFLNMEIERYTLATGETALTGFSRLWRHWGLVFVVMIYFANLWPGWVSASATMLTYLIGGEVVPIALGMLVVVGAGLTFAPVIYVALERVAFAKLAAVMVFVVMAIAFVISREAWVELPRGLAQVGRFPPQLGFALVMGAFTFAGAGGGQNLCQSNWIRDKGFGMGAYVPRLVSPVTGEESALPSTGFTFETTTENMRRWRRWWRMANVEQAVTFAPVTFLAIVFMSMIAYSTVYGRPDLPPSAEFLRLQGERMQAMVGAWFGALYWIIGVFSLFVAAMGVVDYTSRIGADVLKTLYLRESAWSESRIYFGLVWGLILCGCAILWLGFGQPMILLVVSSCVGGLMMCIYSILLIVLNRRGLPAPLRITPWRVAALVWSAAVFGLLAVLTMRQQWQRMVS
jgi:hypothetical protein